MLINVMLFFLSCCCCRPPRTQRAGKDKELHRDSRGCTRTKTPLEPILEDPANTSLPQKRQRAAHKPLQRLRSDEQGLISEDGSSQPPSPTDTAATVVPQPIQKTPDPRRKKLAHKTEQRTPPTSGFIAPRLPGAASPSQKSPAITNKQQDSSSPHIREGKSSRAVLPPLRNVPRYPPTTEPSFTGAHGNQVPPFISSLASQKLDSNQRKKDTTLPSDSGIPMTEIRGSRGARDSAARDELDKFASNLSIDHDFNTPNNSRKKKKKKKGLLDTSELIIIS